jgi:hypothetical protein
VHAAPLAELASGEHDTRLNLAEILAGWKAEHRRRDLSAGRTSAHRPLGLGRCAAAGRRRSLPRPGMDTLDPFSRARRTRSGHLSGRRHSAAAPSVRDSGLGLGVPRAVSIRRRSSCALRRGLRGSASAFPAGSLKRCAITSLPRCMREPVMTAAGDRPLPTVSHCPAYASALMATAAQ